MDVVLVSMPFAEVQRPSIALGLLQASLAHTDVQSEIVYGNFGLAERIGLVAYQAMQMAPTDHLLGEWCFAGCLFPTDEARDEEYLNLVLEIRCACFPASLDERKDQMRWVRGRVPLMSTGWQTSSWLSSQRSSGVVQSFNSIVPRSRCSSEFTS
jgi:magnesium-protoporphyrin IX monomethyl ester (oxidative) cyclase